MQAFSRRCLTMQVTINGRRYQIRFRNPGRNVDATCDDPTEPRPEIWIRPALQNRPVELTETVIHECLHAQGWPLDEEFVTGAAEDITAILDKLGLIRKD